MDKFSERHKLLKLTQQDTENITNLQQTDIELVTFKLSKKKSPGQMLSLEILPIF